MTNPKTTRMALKEDMVYHKSIKRCWDIYTSRRFLWYFWTPYMRFWKHIWAKCQTDAWNQAYQLVYFKNFYYGPDDKESKNG